MGFFTSNKSKVEKVNWIQLTSEEQLLKAIESSVEKPVLLFKHSTRCSISSMALNRFEGDWNNETNCDCYYLDLISFRNVSNRIADELKVMHQSPQAILLINKEVVYEASHSSINANAIQAKV